MNPTIASPALQLSPITPDLRERYIRTVADTCRDADHAFANLYMWNGIYRQELAFFEAEDCCRAVVCFYDATGQQRYLFPAGRGTLVPVLEAMREKARQRGEKLMLSAVTAAQLAELNAALPNAFEATEDRDGADYLYRAESLATLAGSKLHAKRNHINAFVAAHQWELLPLTPARFDACRALLTEWGSDRSDIASQNERQAVELALNAYGALDLDGALLVADGAPVAFTLGSMITPDTLCVHVEKAHPEMQGAYPMINREFVRMMLQKHPRLTTVNREDDMGLENLRRAKMAYRPTELLTKFTLTER